MTVKINARFSITRLSAPCPALSLKPRPEPNHSQLERPPLRLRWDNSKTTDKNRDVANHLTKSLIRRGDCMAFRQVRKKTRERGSGRERGRVVSNGRGEETLTHDTPRATTYVTAALDKKNLMKRAMMQMLEIVSR